MEETQNVSQNVMAKLLSAQDVVERIFGGTISYRQLLKLSRDGSIPCLKLSNRYYYVADVVNHWIQVNAATPAYAKIKI